jgi:hypothetical protein
MAFLPVTFQRRFFFALASSILQKELRPLSWLAEPPPATTLVPGLPEDLRTLCAELLRRDPPMRPPGTEVLRRLGTADDAPPSSAAGQVPLVGRAPHLTALASAFAAVAAGQPVIVHVHGSPGVGKSALLRRFLDELKAKGQALVLAGRCYEQEAVPYKALDSLIDALGRHLRMLSEEDAKALLPDDLGLLAQVFPVLRWVESRVRLPDPPIADRQVLRRRALAALRELLVRLGQRSPLVLAIDDLQWGDVDSAALLSELLRPPEAPALLLVACYRSEGAATSPCLEALLSAMAGERVRRRDLVVGPLEPHEARELALVLLDTRDPETSKRAEAVARESGGNPLFAYELAHTARGTSAEGALSLEEVLWARVQRLPGEARRLLEVAAVAGTPLRHAEAFGAAELAAAQRGALALLHAARLLRSTGLGDADALEAYHDRIRETVVARLDAERRREHHGKLAQTLERSGRAEPEVLARHFLGAGESSRAGHFYVLAAGRAAEALAFERAAQLFLQALPLRPVDEGLRLGTQLGEALANAGRGGEAAATYLAAATGADAATAVELRKRAALQLLLSGRVDEGLEAVRAVFRTAGMRIPTSPRRTLLALLFRRLQLRFRGLRFRERREADTPQQDLERTDLCWFGTIGTSMIEPLMGAYFQTRGLLLALQAGEPNRIARALAMSAIHAATEGARSKQRTAHLLRAPLDLADRLPHPYVQGNALFARGLTAFFHEGWQAAHEFCDQSVAIFRNHCTDAARLIDTAQIIALLSLLQRGEIAELSRRCPALLQDAQERGDLYAVSLLGTYLRATVRLAADDPDAARRDVEHALGQWSNRGYHLQHLHGLLAHVCIQSYVGQAESLWDHVARQGRIARRSLLLRPQLLRLYFCKMLAFAALVESQTAANPAPLLQAALAVARDLDRERTAWSTTLAQYVRAVVAFRRGDVAAARHQLVTVVEGCDALDMRLDAAAVRSRLGDLVGGLEGRGFKQAAEEWMLGQQIRNPARIIAMAAPGFPD